MNNDIPQVSPKSPTISRRTVAKGVAWAVPAVAFAGAAPAFAASPVLFGDIGAACKYPGNSTTGCNKYFKVDMTWTNSSGVPLTVTMSAEIIENGKEQSLTYVGIMIGTVWYPAGTNPTVTINPGTTNVTVYFEDTNSGNRSGTLYVYGSYRYNGNDYTATAEETAETFAPCADGTCTAIPS